MRRALVLAAVTALSVARPEMYKEKEDFQYSRSSSDDGTKSGFYGAQRGNMGGNYERAHNMDLLAQHQMGGLVKTVEGELGDGAKQRSGSVFSAANSRGVYGSGHYDLSNLEGRNFQEGTSLGESQSHSSLSSHNAGYGGHSQIYASGANSAYDSRSRYQGYHRAGNSDQALYANTMQSADNLQSASQYDATKEAHSTGYNSQSGYYGQSGSDQSANSNAYGSNYHLVAGSPVRVLVRPGGRVAIPLAAQQTYDASQSSVSNFDQNAINSESEVLGSIDQQSSYKPTNNAKHYESSYRYRKEWEKHDTKPIAGAPISIPTVNPYLSNSEFNEDVQAQGYEHQHEASLQEAQNVHSSNQQNRGYNVKSAVSSSQLRQQAAYNAQKHSAAFDTASAANIGGSSAYMHEAYNNGGASANLHAANLNNQVEDFGSKPKSYQSSYSYHKSWERQGDPYVIQPSTNGLYTTADAQASQRLTASSLNQGVSGYGSHQYGTHYHQGHQGYSSNNGVDCDENGHIRVARSYNLDRDPAKESQNLEDLGQQTQNLEDFSQQSQNLEQQSQNLEDFGQHQQSQNLEDLGQQAQNLEDFGQQSQNIQDFGQQAQNLEDFGQQSQNIQDLGQQAQNLEDFGQQSQNIQDLGQQAQNLEDFGQQSQNLQDLGQQAQNLEDFGQQSQNIQDLGQQEQNLEDFGQQSQNMQELGQQAQNLEDFGQQSQNIQDLGRQPLSVGQLTQSKWDNLDQGQQAQTQFDRTENLDQQTQNQWDQQSQTDLGQQSQNTWSKFEITQNHNDSKDTEPQLDGIEHTGYNHHDVNHAFQTQENVFEINHPAVTQAESHKTQEDTSKPNPLADTIFNTYIQNQENRQVNKEIQHYFSQSESANTGQFTSSWSINQGNQNAVPPNWQQYLDSHHTHTGYGYDQHNYIPANTGTTGYNTNPWMFEQTYNNNPNNNFQPNDYSNFYTSTQTHVSRNDHSTHSTSNIHLNSSESGSTGLTSLWDLIDDIEKQTTTTDKKDSFNINQENMESASRSELMQNFNKNHFNTEKNTPFAFVPSTSKSKIETTTIKQHNRPHDMERGDIEPEKLRPQEEVGRGDIGPEDLSNDNSNSLYKPSNMLEIKPKNITFYKTPEEIETLSLTKENNKTTLAQSTDEDKRNNHHKDDKQLESDLNVLGLAVKPLQHFDENNRKLQSDIQRTTNTTPKSSSNYVHPNINVEQGPKDLEPQYTGQHFEKSEQQLHHQIVDFGQQSEHLGQEHLEQQFENSNQQNIDFNQQNIDHHRSNKEHGPDEIHQENLFEQFENLGQQSENLNQESFNQFEDFGQQSVNLGPKHGQFDSHYGQQSEGFHQENLNDFGQHEQLQQETLSQFEQPQGHLGHSQREQQLENWSQQSENLQQQSQSEDLWKPKEDLQQAQQAKIFVPVSSYHMEGRESHATDASEPVVEPEIFTKNSSNVDTPPETATEKVGFWNKVGSKFVGAKDKVKSWFSSG